MESPKGPNQSPPNGGYAHGGIPHDLPQTNAVSELYRLRDQFRITQIELERERKSHRLDKANADVKIARLEKAASSPALPSRRSNGSLHPLTARGVFTAITLAGIALVAVLAMRNSISLSQSPGIWQSKAPRIQLNTQTSPNPPALVNKSIRVRRSNPEQLKALGGPSDFSAAMSRLDNALNSLPGRPQAILETVHSWNGSSVCNFEWTGGQPAIIYSGGTPAVSLSGTLNSCAEAVENFQSRSANPR